jgi:hypothetical protein
MICKISQRIVDLAHQQILAIVQAAWFHAPHFTKSSAV